MLAFFSVLNLIICYFIVDILCIVHKIHIGNDALIIKLYTNMNRDDILITSVRKKTQLGLKKP